MCIRDSIKEDKYILVPYHTINGNGLLKCIKPDIIFIDGIGYKMCIRDRY